MGEKIQVLAQELFGRSSVEECDLHEIRSVVQQYPYFAAAQFLLLEKLKSQSSPDYIAQVQKAVLYYHDPLQFEDFISPERFFTELIEEESEKVKGGSVEKKEESVEGKLESEETSGKPDRSDEPQTSNIKPQTSSDFVFEPFHTVDYFASQGIKLSQEEMPGDKLGKQLKSFTAWLRTMKRLPATEIARDVDAGSEKNVQHLAEDSIHSSEVVTEAMAEVWVKQGEIQKALEVYNKLSLLNPSKKAYFAALIENLKP